MSPLNSGLARSAFRGDNIVTDGLVAHLDSANMNSYDPLFPNSWRHVYPAGDYSTMVNTSSSYAASFFPPPAKTNYPFVFLNYLSYIKQRTSSVLKSSNFVVNPVTVEIWFSISSSGVGSIGSFASPNYNNVSVLFGWEPFKIVLFKEPSSSSYYIGQSTGNNTVFTSYRAIPNLVLGSSYGSTYSNTWRQIVCVMSNYPERLDYNKIYINGQKLTTLGNPSDLTYQTMTYSGDFVIGGYINNLNGSTYHNSPLMFVSIVRIYDRELTLSEIKQNFNANRGRFE
jgi:hypothetical protein